MLKQKGSLLSSRFQQDIPRQHRQSVQRSFALLRRTERARSTRIPRQPIPRGLMAHMPGRSSDLSVTASFAFPGIRPFLSHGPGICSPGPLPAGNGFFPVTSAALRQREA